MNCHCASPRSSCVLSNAERILLFFPCFRSQKAFLDSLRKFAVPLQRCLSDCCSLAFTLISSLYRVVYFFCDIFAARVVAATSPCRKIQEARRCSARTLRCVAEPSFLLFYSCTFLLFVLLASLRPNYLRSQCHGGGIRRGIGRDIHPTLWSRAAKVTAMEASPPKIHAKNNPVRISSSGRRCFKFTYESSTEEEDSSHSEESQGYIFELCRLGHWS